MDNPAGHDRGLSLTSRAGHGGCTVAVLSGELDITTAPGAEQPHLSDLLQVVLYGVGRSADGCHPGGGKTLVVTTGNRRLVLAGARFLLLLTSRLPQSVGLTVGRA